MKYSLSKIDAAVDQLDWAIKLFLDQHAFVSAITLSGAAEEIFGEAVNETEASSFRLLKDKLAKEYGLKPSIVAQEHLNKAKNWLKHWKDRKDDECIELELETEALQYIIRAINNLLCYDKCVSSETPRFLEWLVENKNELFESL